MASSVGEQLTQDLRKGSVFPNNNRKTVTIAVKPVIRDPRVKINISGIRYQLLKKTLTKHAHFRLTRILQKPNESRKNSTSADNESEDDLYDHYDDESQEYYFERNPEIFPAFITFFCTGHLHIPRNVCVEAFVEECNYWGLLFNPNDCCQGYHQSQWEMIETVRKANRIFTRRQTEMLAKSESILVDEDHSDDNDDDEHVRHAIKKPLGKWRQLWRAWSQRVWDLFEEPDSSTYAKFVNFFSSLMVLISTVILCLNTHPDIATIRFKTDINGTIIIPKIVISKEDNYYLKIVETICIIWFTFEFTTRCIVARKKKVFFKTIMNWIDVLAIVPFYVGLIIQAAHGEDYTNNAFTDARRFMQILRIFRIIRIFKMARHSAGLQVLGYTVRNSGPELGLLGMLLLMGMTLFASLIYYAEEDQPDTKFSSIIAAFWWAIITMTTVGYGDMVPHSTFGKIVGSCCCVSGILFIALPIPTIVSNFSSFYKDHRNKKRVEALYGEEDGEEGEGHGEDHDSDSNVDDDYPDVVMDASPKTLNSVASSWNQYKRRLSTMSSAGVGSNNRVGPSSSFTPVSSAITLTINED